LILFFDLFNIQKNLLGIKMKKLLAVFVLAFSISGFAQFKDSGFPTSDIRDGILAKPSSSLFGFLSSPNFHMNQSYSLSYSTFGNQGLALGVYTNSMSYDFSKNLNVQLEASIVQSPYSTLGSDFQKSINGIYLSRAAVNYRPWKDVSISFQYSRLPYNYYSPYSLGGLGGGWYSGYGGMDPFWGR